MHIQTLERKYLQSLVALWNEEIGQQFPMREKLFEQNSFNDENVAKDGSFVALDDKENVIGFVIAKHWQEQKDVRMPKDIGWIQALLVSKAHRRRGIGSTLLKKTEDYFQSKDIRKWQLGGDPFHYFPGIPAEFEGMQQWAEQRGFKHQGDAYDLINEDKMTIPFPKEETVEISLLTLDDQQSFLEFLNRCFPGRWEWEAMKYFEMGGEGREFVIMKKRGDIIGFCRINDPESPFIAQNVYWSPLFAEPVGGIGPLGIDEREQKQGYGLAIVQAGAAFLQKRQIDTIVIDWTNLLSFYKKLGFHPWKMYRHYGKEM